MSDGLPQGGLVTFGEAMGVVAADRPGPLEQARCFSLGIGGAELNVAIGAARLGGRVMWIGRLGRDATGDLIERRLRAEGVGAVIIRDDAFTGLMVKHERFAGVLAIDYHRAGSAASRLAPGDLPADAIAAAGIVHVTGITPALSASCRQATLHGIRVARDAGVCVSVDVNYRAKLWDATAARPALAELVAQADIVFAGPEEARLLLGGPRAAPPDELAHALTALGPGEAIVKDGARGATAVVGGRVLHQPALAVAVVDPVGAGDALVAAYLAERLAGRSPARRLETAVTVAGLAVTVPGDCEGLPRHDELALARQRDIVR